MRADLLRAMGRPTDAAADNLTRLNIPQRDPPARPKLVDLSRYYNAAFEQSWLDQSLPGLSLSSLPKGLQNLGGMEFDLRGIVQLAGTEPGNSLDEQYPTELRAIPIRSTCQRLHFLQGAGGVATEGTQIGSYIIHYANGRKETLPIIFGEDVESWAATSDAPKTLKRAKGVWAAARPKGGVVRLFDNTRENPHPEIEITSVDFVSALTHCPPFLIAITLD